MSDESTAAEEWSPSNRRLLQERRSPVKDSGDLLLREVNHRAANSLQIASSMLTLRARRTTSPEAQSELIEAANRIRSVGLVHKRLYQLNEIDAVEFGGYLRDLCTEIAGSYKDTNMIELKFQSEHTDPIFLHSDSVTKLGLVVTELVTNCAKHAGAGTICRIGLLSLPDRIEVSVSDNGAGLPLAFASDGKTGLGMQIVHSLMSQLGGQLETMPSNDGASFVAKVPTQLA